MREQSAYAHARREQRAHTHTHEKLLIDAFLRVAVVCVASPLRGAGAVWWMTRPWELDSTPSSHDRRHLPPAVLRIIRVRKWTVVTTCVHFFHLDRDAEDRWSPINFILMIAHRGSIDEPRVPWWTFLEANRLSPDNFTCKTYYKILGMIKY